MAAGKKRPGSKGNRRAVKHGIFSKTITDPETLEAFNRHYAELKKDPVTAILACAALLGAHVERAMRFQDQDGFMHVEKVDADGKLTTRKLELLEPISRALEKKGRLVLIAHEVEAKRQGTSGESGATVVIKLHPDLVEE